MKFSIVTPNFNGMPYLPRCIASVRDQTRSGIDVEHIVVDGGSTDGSCGFLAKQPVVLPGYRFEWQSETDQGMYDAINKGWRMAGGEIWSWLNSDEQYLPETLAIVAAALKSRAAIDFVYGNTLLLRPDGSLIAFRKAAPLRLTYLRASHLYVHSSSLFFRRRCIADREIWLNPNWRAAGDHEWMLRLMGQGAKGYRLPRYLSAFFMTGTNLGLTDTGTQELRRLRSRQPGWIRLAAPFLRACRCVEKWLAGGFSQACPLAYRIVDQAGSRVECHATSVSWRYRDT